MKKVLLAILVGLVACGCEKSTVDESPEVSLPRRSRLIPDVGSRRAAVPKKDRPHARAGETVEDRRSWVDIPDQIDATLTADDRRRYCDLQLALDDEDLDKIVALVDGLPGESSPAVKEMALDALAWFSDDVKALEKIRLFVRDPEASVSELAYSKLSDNLQNLEDDTRARFLRGMISMCPERAATEFVLDQIRVSGISAAMMETLAWAHRAPDSTARDEAKALYREITGEYYTTPEALRAWLEENGHE